jgi:YHS domain-containing protein
MKQLLFAVMLLTAGMSVRAQDVYTNKEGVALDGYDVVAYFKEGKAVKGRADFAHVYKGVTWYFSSARNRDDFKNNASSYEPECGGWCAWGVAEKADKFPVDPNTFKIVDGKLYFFFNGPYREGTFNALEPWNKDEARLLKSLDKNWQMISKKPMKH